jgi:sigma-E factor negative regulatory protein RseC
VVSTSPGQAKVAIVRSEACGNCPAKSMCSTASGNINVLEVSNPVKAKPGEKVVIELQPEALVKATAMLYLFPAVAIVTGATAGWLRSGSDLGAMIGALAGFAAASLFLYLHGRKHDSEKGPKISKVLSPGSVSNIDHSQKAHSFSS